MSIRFNCSLCRKSFSPARNRSMTPTALDAMTPNTPTALDSKAQGRGQAAHPGVPTPIRRVYPNGVGQRRRGPILRWIIRVCYRRIRPLRPLFLACVLDQFEQWLHAKKEQENTELVQALRQCDGGRVHCIVMVRDDFWMAATRFMRELEVRLVEAQNSAAVDLFPIRHAEKVLAAFGRAFGALPDKLNDANDNPETNCWPYLVTPTALRISTIYFACWTVKSG